MESLANRLLEMRSGIFPATLCSRISPTSANLVNVQAFAGSEEFAGSKGKFPVLVPVKGAPWRVHRPGVDVVAVLDVSGSMGKNGRLDHMKQAMSILIDLLTKEDRLSIVSFDKDVHPLMELTSMSSNEKRDRAKDTIKNLEATSGNNIGDALQKGVQILEGRSSGEMEKHRVGCMLLLSDGEYPEIYEQEQEKEKEINISPKFPAYTFGLGTDHNAKSMRHIADKTFATYSFVSDVDKDINAAFELLMAGLYSVAATSVKITLKAHGDVAIISPIDAGGFKSSVESSEDCSKSWEIEINDIYAGEHKSFVVYLDNAVDQAGKNGSKLMTVGCRYQSLAGGVDACELDESDVCVLPPRAACSQAELELLAEMEAELDRTQLVKDVSEMLLQDPDDEHKTWEEFKLSVESRGGPGDIAEMKGLDEKRSAAVVVPALPYMMSWMSCHMLQRATTKGLPSSSGAFRQVFTGDADARIECSLSCVRQNYPGVVLVVFLFLTRMLYVYFGGGGGGGSITTVISTSTANTTALDLSGHPHWPVMEQDLKVMLHKTEDAKISSFFQEASMEDMYHQMDRYLYLAIVHATALRRHHAGHAISDAVAVRSEAETYLQVMVERMRHVELDLPSFQDASAETMSYKMNTYLYSTIVQSSVVSRHSSTTKHVNMEADSLLVTKASTTITSAVTKTEEDKAEFSGKIVNGVSVTTTTEEEKKTTFGGKIVDVAVKEEEKNKTTATVTTEVVVVAEMEKATARISELVHKEKLVARVAELESEKVHKETLVARVAELELEMVHKATLVARVAELELEMVHKATMVARVAELELEMVHKATMVARVAELEKEMVLKATMVARVAELEKEMVHKAMLVAQVTKMEQELLQKETMVAGLRSELGQHKETCAQKAARSRAQLMTCAQMTDKWKARVVALGGSVDDE